jgi:hypothetical protein
MGWRKRTDNSNGRSNDRNKFNSNDNSRSLRDDKQGTGKRNRLVLLTGLAGGPGVGF